MTLQPHNDTKLMRLERQYQQEYTDKTNVCSCKPFLAERGEGGGGETRETAYAEMTSFHDVLTLSSDKTCKLRRETSLSRNPNKSMVACGPLKESGAWYSEESELT